MDYFNYIVFALILFIILQRIIPAKGVKQISTSDLTSELKDKNKQFVDVRTPGEFKRYHINGFKNIPLHELAKQSMKELSKDREVIVICQSGMRSQKASKILKKLGFKQVTNVKGGVSAWR